MYKIEKKDYGFKLTFGDFIQASEMTKWLEESRKILSVQKGKFEILVDMRTLKPLPLDSEAVMHEGQKLYKMSGMERSCVILASETLVLQFIRIAQDTGIYAFERYINATKHPDWEKKALAWIVKGEDFDKK